MVVTNQGSNDLSILFGHLGNGEGWQAEAGPRLQSGGVGPLGTILRDVTGDGRPDLIVVNRQADAGSSTGNLAVLPALGLGYFDDSAPTTAGLPGVPAQQPVLTPEGGVLPLENGALVGISPDSVLPVGIVFNPANDGVRAAVVLPDGRVVAALESGDV